MENLSKKQLILNKLEEKSVTKYEVYENTCKTFRDIKKITKEIAQSTKKELNENADIPIEYKERGEFSIQLKFASDLLFANMHSNIFEFPRDHMIMKTSYVKEDKMRSYCGVIHIYNFLSDSFKYGRVNDVGYLVARIFVNKEMHYFVEGKRQVGFLYNDFVNKVLDYDALKNIMESAILYCLDFDLLTPPYDHIKEASVSDIKQSTIISTGKRLGFRFQADHDEIK